MTPATASNGRVVRFAIASPADICPETGGGHVDSPVDETDEGAPVYGCVACERQVVEEADGTYVEVER